MSTYRSATRQRARWRRSTTAVALTAVLALAGCTGSLPTDPVPQAGLPVEVQPRQDVQRLLPRPQPGASVTAIVTGFLRSNVGFSEANDVARDYLTPQLARGWVPTSKVLVVEGSPQVVSTEPGIVSVTAQVKGWIDERGRLTEQPAGTVTTQSFDLTRVEGQWRISEFPDGFGLWLTSQDLDTAFRPSTVYYLNTHLKVFVPDVRWLPHGEGRPTSLARAQLAPVPSYLDGAVSTGSSPDTHLAVGAVPVDPESLVATINLEGPGLGENTDRVSLLRAQLGHALLALNGVAAVDLRVSGRSVDTGDDGPVTLGTDLGYRDVVRDVNRALLRVGDQLKVIDPQWYDLRNLPSAQSRDLDLPQLDSSWTGLAASADLASLASVSVNRTELWRWHADATDINTGIGDALTDPSYDPHGLLWVAGISRGKGLPRVWFVDDEEIKAVAKPLDVPSLDKEDTIRVFRVSPDGSRALLVVGNEQDPGVEKLLMAGIVRGSGGQPVGLDEPVNVAPTLVHVVSARWASTTELVATGQRAGDARMLAFRVPLGGWLGELGEQAGLVDIFAVPTGEGYSPVLRTEDGRFHVREGTRGWADARNGDELIIPGT